MKYQLSEYKNNIDKNNPENKINSYSQTIDILYESLKSKLLSNLIHKKELKNLTKVKLKDLNPVNKITELESKVSIRKDNINNILINILNYKRNEINLKNNTIEDVNPLSILNKGYSIVYCGKKISNKVNDFKINSNLKIRLNDGEIYSNVKKIKRF
jgi:exodeoxyribonuclease VII large subunit